MSERTKWESGPWPRHVPWPGIEPVALRLAGQHLIHWATPVRANFKILKRFYLILDRKGGRKRERNIDHLPPSHPQSGTWPIPQACALIENRASDPQFIGQCSVCWATPARAPLFNTENHLLQYHLLRNPSFPQRSELFCLGQCYTNFIFSIPKSDLKAWI